MVGGGAERVMAIICNKLVERGHEVYLAADLSFPIVYELDKNIKLLDLKIPNEKNAITRQFHLLRNIRKIAKKVKPDIIISFVWAMNGKVIMATKGLNIPIIVSEHCPFYNNRDREKPLPYEALMRYHVNKGADIVTVLTQYDYDFLGKKMDNRIVMHNPLTFKPSLPEERAKRRKNVLGVGSVDRWHHKGFDFLLRVWAGVAPKYPDWVLEIAGGGKEESFDYLKGIAKEYNILDSVSFLGFRTDVDKLLEESSIFALTSRHEGLPMVLLEALSKGCACISFWMPGSIEIIEHNVNGLIVKEKDIEEMKTELMRLMDDENLRERLSHEGIKSLEHFDPEVIVDKWEMLFDDMHKKTKKK